jgi:hypothetical protein
MLAPLERSAHSKPHDPNGAIRGSVSIEFFAALLTRPVRKVLCCKHLLSRIRVPKQPARDDGRNLAGVAFMGQAKFVKVFRSGLLFRA